MNILIFGGSGNISSFLVRKLLKKNLKVEVITRNSKNNLRDIIFNKNLTKTFIDIKKINKKNFLKKINKKKYDIIINFICYDEIDAKQFYNLINKITKRIIIISTVGGYARDTLPINEKTKIKTNWVYAKKKYKMENFFLKKKIENLNILRFGHTYGHILPFPVGPSDWTIPHLMKKKIPVIVHNNGKNTWSLLHCEDAAEAIFQIITAKKIDEKIINIVSPHKTNWNYIVKLLIKNLKSKSKIKYMDTKVILKKCRYFAESVYYHKRHNEYYDISLLKKIIPKWKQKISLEAGIKKTIQWFKKDKKRRKINIKMLSMLSKLTNN